jgi:hypothetical protein
LLFLFYTVSEVYTISKEVSNRWVFFYFAFYTETVSSSKVQVQSIKLIL